MIGDKYWSSLVPEGKEKDLFPKCYFLTFWNRLVRAGLSQGSLSKTTTFVESTWKMSLACPPFLFSVTLFLWHKLDLKIGKNFLKNTAFFSVLHVHKNYPMALALWNVTDSANVEMSASF